MTFNVSFYPNCYVILYLQYLKLLFETQVTLNLPQWKPRANKPTMKIAEKTYKANNSAKTAHPFEQTGNIHLCLWVYYGTEVVIQAAGALQNSSILAICHYILTFTEQAFDRLNLVTAKHKFHSHTQRYSQVAWTAWDIRHDWWWKQTTVSHMCSIGIFGTILVWDGNKRSAWQRKPFFPLIINFLTP